MVQHTAIRIKAIEEYLTWLLREAEVLGHEDSIALQASFDVDNVGGDLGNIREVEIGGVVAQPPGAIALAPMGDDVLEETFIGRARARFERAMSVLVSLMGPVEAERIIEAVPEDADLEVAVSIAYRARRRGVDRATLNELATSLRNIDDGEITVKAKDGRRHGDKVWLQEPMTFQRINDNGDLLELEDTRDQLLEVHRRFLHDGKIE